MKGGTNMADRQKLEAVLYSKLPASVYSHIPLLVDIILNESGDPIAATQTAAVDKLDQVLTNLAGKQILREHLVVAFGDNSQLGDVSIRDIAGRDILTFNINLGGLQPTVQVPPVPLAEGRRLRIETKLENAQSELNLRLEKCKRLREAHALGAPPEVLFKLEHQIADEERSIAALETEIDKLESQLR
jgi:hypothetical protein